MRYIQFTDEMKQRALEEFKKKLETERFSNANINFTFNLVENNQLEDNDKVILNIRAEAWLKMWSLVSSESGEIGWHGTVTRHSEKMFEITDILVYPQTVTGVTVETDDIGYGDWLHKELSDEQINTLRFHGHSHVNMSVSPSGVDTTWYNQILQGLFKDDYYIFVILNKREDYFIEIYDLKTNAIYEKKDIIINVILSDNNYLKNWVELTKKKALKPKTYLSSRTNLAFPEPFDADPKESEEQNFEDFLLNMTSADLKDSVLIQGVINELENRGRYNMYFGLGYLQWRDLTDAEKIEVAQAYYEAKTTTTIKDKQLQYQATKLSKKKKKKRGYNWEDLYD